MDLLETMFSPRLVCPNIFFIIIQGLLLCYPLVTAGSFINTPREPSFKANFSSNAGAGTQLHASTSSSSPCTSSNDRTIEEVRQMNVKRHEEYIRKSEDLFYGFYGPDGFQNFDMEHSPNDWLCYSLSDDQIQVHNGHLSSSSADNENSNFTKSMNIWETMMELDTRIVPPPFTKDELARVSLTPILSPEECDEIIHECENHHWGWGTSDGRYGTPSDRIGNMIRLEDLSRSYSLVNFELMPRLFPAIMDAFPTLKASSSAENFRLVVSRVVKYDASKGRVELGLHRDGKLMTANIALNKLDEYEGGGTYIEGLHPVMMEHPIKLERGHVLLHPGDVLHGGAPITKGQRYVLVCFILDKTIIPHEKYCHDRMVKDIEALRCIPDDHVSREGEREALLTSASRHCADAFALAEMHKK